jgi:hypothetical protein
MENVSDSKIALPSIKPSLFGDFVSWIYTDNYLPVESTSLGVAEPCTELWAMGNFLQVKPSLGMTLLFPILEIDSNYQAPSFQNFCFDDYRNWCKENIDNWPCISDIKQIYNITSKGSLLRQFAAQSMTYKNPFSIHSENPKVISDET